MTLDAGTKNKIILILSGHFEDRCLPTPTDDLRGGIAYALELAGDRYCPEGRRVDLREWVRLATLLLTELETVAAPRAPATVAAMTRMLRDGTAFLREPSADAYEMRLPKVAPSFDIKLPRWWEGEPTPGEEAAYKRGVEMGRRGQTEVRNAAELADLMQPKDDEIRELKAENSDLRRENERLTRRLTKAKR